MKKAAVYMITCKSNGKIYIGSSVNVYNRFREHKRDLKNNKHHSTYLQRCYNKYGENSLEFSILCECSEDELLRNEQLFIDELNPEFNTLKIAGSRLGFKHTEESKKKMSITRKGRTGKLHHLSRSILQYNLDGELIQEFGSAREAARFVNTTHSNILAVCDGKLKTTKGYIWKRK